MSSLILGGFGVEALNRIGKRADTMGERSGRFLLKYMTDERFRLIFDRIAVEAMTNLENGSRFASFVAKTSDKRRWTVGMPVGGWSRKNCGKKVFPLVRPVVA